MRRLVVLMFAAGMWLAPPAFADDGDSTSTPPPPVISTGGKISGTNQGSSCGNRQTQKFGPVATSNPYGWAQPDWPGFFTVNAPTPSSGCSR
jgi:hypothetical protein